MRIAYLPGTAKTPQPSLGGALTRYRPILAVRVTGAGGSWILDGLLDTGSDDTIFPEWIAPMVGIDLNLAIDHEIRLAGRAKSIRCRYHSAILRITDGIKETYEWEGVIGFVAIPLKCPLLGHAGFLQYFDVSFLGADRATAVSPNRTFAGTRS